MLIDSGEGQRFVGDNLESFAAGDVVLIGPQLPHSWLARSDPQGYAIVCFQFQAPWIRRHFQDLPECAGIMELLEQAMRGIVFPAEPTDQVRQQLRSTPVDRPFERLMVLLQTLHQLSQISERRTLSSSLYQLPGTMQRDERKINAICQHLLEHFTYPVSQEAVAARFAMSTTALSRFFKKHTGKTFTAYIHELRIARACELLSQTDQSIQSIANSVGFGNISQFNRIFARLKDMSPRTLRKKLLSGQTT